MKRYFELSLCLLCFTGALPCSGRFLLSPFVSLLQQCVGVLDFLLSILGLLLSVLGFLLLLYRVVLRNHCFASSDFRLGFALVGGFALLV